MCLSPINLKDPNYRHDSSFSREMATLNGLIVPCGKCIECQKDIATEWAYRVVDELKLHAENCFITLTYAKTDKSLHRVDFTKFIKRLRKAIEPIKIRYFGCGEYGSRSGRPHYHFICFGWKPKDLIPFFKTDSGGQVYKSQFVADVWASGLDKSRERGFVTIEEVSFDTAKYCALYMQKFQELEEGMEKPFRVMSRMNGGIGFGSIDREQILSTDKVYHGGYYKKTPRYYLKVLERDGVDLTTLKENRLKTAKFYQSSIEATKKAIAEQERFTGAEHIYTKYDREEENFKKAIDNDTEAMIQFIRKTQ